MANLKEIRTRITSVKSTQQITSAMKLVSASKLRRAQTAIQKMRPYAAKLQEFLRNLSASLDDSEGSVYTEGRAPDKVLIVVLTSNKGLCGGFNSHAIRAAQQRILEEYKDQNDSGNLKLLTIGKKGSEFFTRRNFKVHATKDEIYDSLNFETVSEVAVELMEQFKSGEFDRIEIVYNQFVNAAVQKISVEQYLPVLPPETEGESNMHADYIFEPDKEEIVKELIPKILKIQLYKALLDSFASEHGARMTAMHKATDNAQELLKDLNLTYNKVRQATITNEILEIVSGAEALKG